MSYSQGKFISVNGGWVRILHVVAITLWSCAIGSISWAQETASSADVHSNLQTSKQQPKTSPATAEILSSYEGQNVTSIEVAGHPSADPNQFEPLFAQQAGRPFSKENVDKTVAALKATGKFNNVQLQVEPEATGVRILLVPEPAVWFGLFTFPGAEVFPYSKLIQVANYPPEAPFNTTDVEQDRKNLTTFFRQEGYFRATVDPEVSVDEAHGLANLLFRVNLGRLAKFGSIEIANAPLNDAAAFSRSLQTIAARVRGAAIRPGKTYHRTTIDKAAQYLQSRLAKKSHLAAKVQLSGADFHPDTNRADIDFDVKPGPKIQVDIKGAHLYSWTRKSLLPVYQGIGVDEESIREGQEALASYFQAKGFFDVKVISQVTQESGGEKIVYTLDKEKKHKVSSIQISGNAHIPSTDLDSHLTIQKAHLFFPGRFSNQLVKTSANNVKAVYQAQGYGSVNVVPAVMNDGGNVKVIFKVIEGPRNIVSSLRIEGADTFPESKFAPNGLKLDAGEPFSEVHVEADRAGILAHYLEAGYLTCSFRETATVASRDDPHHINVVYHIYEGPLVHTKQVETLGRIGTKQRLINEDVSSIKPGQPLTETELLTSESKLYDHTGVFDWAEVDPRRQITTQTEEDVLVKVHEAKKNSTTYGFGFEVINRGGSIPSGTVTLPNLPPLGLPSTFSTNQQTFYGPRGSFQYTRNNVRGKGESISFTGFAGRLDQRGAAYYIDPNFVWSRWRATMALSAERNEENPIYSSQQEVGSLQFQRYVDKAKANTLFVRYSFSKTNLTRLEIPSLVPAADQNVRLSTLAANFTHDTRDNTLDEHKGMLDSAEIDFNTTKLGSSVNFAKFTGQAAYYKLGFHNIVFANSLRVGLAQQYSDSRVPLSEEFFTGGGNSLRGFPLDGAGPQRSVQICGPETPNTCPGTAANQTISIQVPTGGSELLLINSEARIPLPFKKGLGIVAFYDGGNVFPNVGFHDFTSLYTNNVGVGLRYATPVGPVRIDLGHNLNPVSGIQSTQYFISIGQAF